MTAPAVTVRPFRFRHEDGTELHFRNMEMSVQRGERVTLLGCNGSGKTTLLGHLIGLYGTPDTEHTEVLGLHPVRDAKLLRTRVGFVLQNAEHQIIAPTVYDDIAFSLRCRDMPEREVKRRVEAVMERLGIGQLGSRVPHYLSGGHKAKVVLAGALAQEPELLVLDEPFTGIDPVCTRELAETLNEVNRQDGVTLVMSNHNIETVPLLADTVYLLATGGNLEAKGVPAEVFAQVEVMARCHVHPPVLNLLQKALAERGISLDAPLTVEAVADCLAALRGKGGERKEGEE